MRRSLALIVSAACLASVGAARASDAPAAPVVVVAMIDTGINPYSPAFRDTSDLAQQYPATYIPGYPDDARALNLSLDLPYAQAVVADKDVWDNVAQNTLYYIPGTKIVGAISIGRGGTSCNNVPNIPPAGGTVNGFFCSEHAILDDAGHGTMTASRATSFSHSLGSGARVVEIEGLGALSVNWAAAQPWIDVQSNSWASATPAQASPDIAKAFANAATKELVFAASGNGLAFTHGFAPTPTEIGSTAAPGVFIVGAHDNGHVTAWPGAPAHVVADGYGGYTGTFHSSDAPHPDPIACCTSAAAPYAAGGAANLLYEARRIVGDTGTGLRDGALAVGPNHTASGPLDDGILTLGEARAVYLETAEARPREGADDGLLHFTGGPAAPQHPEYGPGENPFCEGCWTLPLQWTQVPDDQPAYASIGYGAINERSAAAAAAVLRGDAPLPVRPAEDAFFAQDQDFRRTTYPK